MSVYDDLVERCVKATWDAKDTRPAGFSANARRHDTRVILAEVLRTLETVTPAQIQAAAGFGFAPDEYEAIEGMLRAMLRASPLAPTK